MKLDTLHEEAPHETLVGWLMEFFKENDIPATPDHEDTDRIVIAHSREGKYPANRISIYVGDDGRVFVLVYRGKEVGTARKTPHRPVTFDLHSPDSLQNLLDYIRSFPEVL